jgi:hypothetical protein
MGRGAEAEPVGALTRIAVAAVAVAVGAAVLVVLLARGRPAPAVEPRAALAAHASFEPAQVQFGDPVTARVVVLVDRRAIRPDSVRLTRNVSPLTQLGPVRTTRMRRGALEAISSTFTAACLSDGCVSSTGEQVLAPPAVAVDATRVDGGAVHTRAAWPNLLVRGRVTDADLRSTRPPLRTDTAPPPLHYRIAPSTLATLLEAAAALLAAAGIGLVALQALQVVRRRAGKQGEQGQLARALRLARQSETRDAPDRRRALGLVARVLDPRDRRLADAAQDLAWSRPAPEPGPVSTLLDQVEREVPS